MKINCEQHGEVEAAHLNPPTDVVCPQCLDEGMKGVSFIVCGGACPAYQGDHRWDGPDDDDGFCVTTTCSGCGLRAIDYDLLKAE